MSLSCATLLLKCGEGEGVGDESIDDDDDERKKHENMYIMPWNYVYCWTIQQCNFLNNLIKASFCIFLVTLYKLYSIFGFLLLSLYTITMKLIYHSDKLCTSMS